MFSSITPWLLLLEIALFFGFAHAAKHKSHSFSHTPCPAKASVRVAFVTSLTGDYEKTCKRPAPQTIPADFLAFTDDHFHTQVAVDKKVAYNAWTRLDAEPYRHGLLVRDQHAGYVNSFTNNNHSFNRAKFFKENLHRLPELAKYHILIWLDATVQIVSPHTAEYVVDYLCNRNVSILTVRHEHTKLLEEVQASNIPRYTTTVFRSQNQPLQDIQKQYEQYIKKGYKDEFFGSYAVALTCFVAFNMLQEITPVFLERWWLQNLMFSTQDQVSFPYVAWSLGVRPYLLPDRRVHGNSTHNTLFVKHSHHLR